MTGGKLATTEGHISATGLQHTENATEVSSLDAVLGQFPFSPGHLVRQEVQVKVVQRNLPLYEDNGLMKKGEPTSDVYF